VTFGFLAKYKVGYDCDIKKQKTSNFERGIFYLDIFSLFGVI
jgi:hypothetical protein